MGEGATIRIETREHLISTLGEAAELEHSLMCMYLYAVFSLKTEESEDLSSSELVLVKKWRKEILGICVQEMGHLALVCNVTTAVGGSVRLARADFPVRSGLFPEDFVLELAPFNLETLEHFIFLERPENHDMDDSDAFTAQKSVVRDAKSNRLMTHIGSYSTVGELYQAVATGIETLVSQVGEARLFCGSKTLQLGPEDVKLEGLQLVNSKDSALSAIKLIVEQGEGSRTPKGSHFEKFETIKKEYLSALEGNPKFCPCRAVARNPVMMKPVDAKNKVYIDHSQSVLILDLVNALYTLMLRFLLQIYSMEQRPAHARKVVVKSAFSLMHLIGIAAGALTLLPASKSDPRIFAGISFDLNRHLAAIELSSERIVLLERLDEILKAITSIGLDSLSVITEKLHEIRLELSNVSLE